MKKRLILTLTIAVALSLGACGGVGQNIPQGAEQAATPNGTSAEQPQTADVTDWVGSYQTTDADEQVSIVINASEDCQISYREKKVQAKAIAVHDIGDGALELQMLDEENLLHHLVYFPTNPSDKRFNYSLTEYKNASAQMIANRFMSGDSAVAKGQSSPTVSVPTEGEIAEDAPTIAVGLDGFVGTFYHDFGEEKPIETLSYLEIKKAGSDYTMTLHPVQEHHATDLGLTGGSHSGKIEVTSVSGNYTACTVELEGTTYEIELSEESFINRVGFSLTNLQFYKINPPATGQPWYSAFVGTYIGDRVRALGYDEDFKIEADGTVVFRTKTVTYTGKFSDEPPVTRVVMLDAAGSDGAAYLMSISLDDNAYSCSVAVYQKKADGPIVSDIMINSNI